MRQSLFSSSMTKFILHGGCTRIDSESNRKFFKEITRDLSSGATIVCSFHAAPVESWGEKFEYIQNKISLSAQEKTFNFILAEERVEEFVKQLQRADAVYFHGGDTLNLKNALSGIENLSALLRNKVVAGSSAGVNVFARYSFSTIRKIVAEGLGILPIKTMCHYSEEKSQDVESLKAHGEDLEMYLIPEEHFVVINQ